MKFDWRTHYKTTFWLLAALLLALVIAVGLCAYFVGGSTASGTDIDTFSGIAVFTTLVLVGADAIVFLTLLYAPDEQTPTLFDRLVTGHPDTRHSPRSPLVVSGEKAMSTLLAGVMAMAGLRLIHILLTSDFNLLAAWYGLLVLIMAILLIYSLINGFPATITHFAVLLLLLSPLLMQVWSPTSESFLFWSVCGLLISLFIFPRHVSRKYLYAFLALQMAFPLLGLVVGGHPLTIEMLWEIVGLLFFGCGLYMAMDTYISYSQRSRTELLQASAQLEEAQAVYTQKEKMAALGQLISGVAHEINTPMGAIKASSENMDSSARALFSGLIYKTRDFSEEDIADFLTLTDICSQSVREMRNTMEMRKAKPLLIAFFKRINPETAPRVVDLLAKMEICGMEKIESHIEVFKNPRLVTLLEMVQTVFPYLNATQNIQFATSRVSKIVFALKSYSHTSLENEYLTFDLISNLQNILVLYHNQIKYGVEVIREFDEDIPLMYGNPDELGQVWSNLIQNAIQAMNGVGTLTIQACYLPEEKIRLIFKDTGGGIKPEHLKQMFDVFFTTKPPGEGSGLGLNICRRIVERHGGSITVDNKPGVGVSFIVTLPVTAQEPVPEATETDAANHPEKRNTL